MTRRREAQPADADRDFLVPAFLGVLCLCIAGTIAATFSSGVRHQLALTFTHAERSFVELSISPDEADRVCRPTHGDVDVSFTVVAHGVPSGELPFSVDVANAGGGVSRQQDVVRTVPDVPVTASARVSVDASTYDLTVTLGRSHLGLHCGARP